MRARGLPAFAAVAAVAFSLGCGGPDAVAKSAAGDGGTPPGAVSLGTPESGVATYYDATGAGNCSFDATPSDLDVAAMNATEYAGSAVCGECVAVTGPKGAVTVRIVDSCPGCGVGHLDLSQEAFAKIADVSAGRVPISWQVVSCNVSGGVSYHYKDGSSQYWTAIQVRNHRLPIKQLELKQGGKYVNIPRESYNYFVASGGAGPGPVTVRITAVDGQQLEDTLPAATSNATSAGASQFK